MFPIPMRGNEDKEALLGHQQAAFPIPMRVMR